MREWFLGLFTPLAQLLAKIGVGNSPITYSRAINFVEGMQAGDVLLVYKPWQATNWLIPGKFKHAALYVGHGKVVESTGELGVHESDVYDFLMHYHKVALMRPAFSTQVESQSAVREAVSKLGSGYDYRLDDDDTKYYCSELIIHAYSTAHPRIDLWKRELLGDNIVYPQDIYEDTSNWKVIKEAP